jgi:serine/threonine-protein kinase
VTDAEADERDPRVGAQVDRYTIVRLLGKGGMGAVYEARHAKLGRRVAIKFLLPELAARAEILRRFENEAVAAGGLEHPNLVAVIDLGGAADGSPYLVMEFLQGEDCARLVRHVGALPVARAVNIVLQACRGVAVAHDAGIVHRDLKPENLFLTDVGDGGDQIKVLDFGIAKLRPVDGQAATRTGSTFGTTHYMSPEQARGASEVDARTDVWSMGVVLYELLSGRKPFDAEQPLNVVHQILNATPPPLATARPGLPRGLVAAVERALRKDADARFPSIRALATALAPFADPTAARADAGAGSTRPTPATNTSQPAPRGGLGRRAGTALALLGAMGIATISLLGARGRATAPAPAPSLPAPTAASVPAAAPAAASAATSTVTTGGGAGGPTPAPADVVPKVSEQSGQSEQGGQAGQGEVVHVAARRAHDEARRSRGPAPAAAAAGPRSDAPARPSLKLDPNPY